MRGLVAVMAMAAACGGGPSVTPDDASPSDGAGPDAFVPTEQRLLGMNDISLLLQLVDDPTLRTTFVKLEGFSTGHPLVECATFDRLAAPGDVGFAYGNFHAVAIRFDACERVAPGPCPIGADGQVRMVFQPVFVGGIGTTTGDAALHASYPIPAAEMPFVVDELRALARLQNFQTASPLAQNPTLTPTPTPSEYAMRLAALVGRYATPDRLQRLTLFAQNANTRPFNWIFRGLERAGADFEDLVIPTIDSDQQRTIVAGGGVSYPTTPVADVPAGFQVTLQESTFDALTLALRKASLVALAEAQNPTLHTFHSLQCAACHVATYLTVHRAQSVNVDPSTIGNTYQSTRDLSLPDSPRNDPTSLRAFGYHGTSPSISQRVANETAAALDELEQRFPPAP